MLRELFIKNFAIIDELRVHFSEGLTIISGETGAGKSIIISALNILLGSRADSGMIRTGSDTAELEALFDIEAGSIATHLLEAQGYEETSQLVLRRVLSAENRHRIYINGRMATMTLLTAITENIAGISGQHEHLKLLKESEHMKILDRFGELTELQGSLQACHTEILPEIKKLEELQSARQSRDEKIDRLEYEKNEIEEAAVQPGEDEGLTQELNRLKNAQLLYESIGNGIEILYNREGAISDQLSHVVKDVERAAQIDTTLSETAQSLEGALLHIQDIAHQLRSYLDSIEFDPARIEQIEARMHVINRLKRKYGFTIEDLFLRHEHILQELSGTQSMIYQIRLTRSGLEALHEKLVETSRQLTEKRRAAAALLANKMEMELTSLNMPDTRFEVVFRPNQAKPDTPAYLSDNGIAISESGDHQPIFMISPNVGETLKPLSKIASGGELSRVILALKAILANSDSVETVIFDEVDAGIGGKTADVVGKKLSNIAASSQVICITHLAQIARFGNHHLRIEKYISDGRTSTRLNTLDMSGRIEETARMLGGQSVTATSRAHAEELLESSGVRT